MAHCLIQVKRTANNYTPVANSIPPGELVFDMKSGTLYIGSANGHINYITTKTFV